LVAKFSPEATKEAVAPPTVILVRVSEVVYPSELVNTTTFLSDEAVPIATPEKVYVEILEVLEAVPANATAPGASTWGDIVGNKLIAMPPHEDVGMCRSLSNTS